MRWSTPGEDVHFSGRIPQILALVVKDLFHLLPGDHLLHETVDLADILLLFMK